MIKVKEEIHSVGKNDNVRIVMKQNIYCVGLKCLRPPGKQ